MMTVSRWGTQCACLFFALLQGLLQSAGATHGNVTTATSPRLNRTNGLYEICISDWTPMVSCDGKNNTADVSGYQVGTEVQALMPNVKASLLSGLCQDRRRCVCSICMYCRNVSASWLHQQSQRRHGHGACSRTDKWQLDHTRQ